METRKIATRDGFGDEIVELGRENRTISTLTWALRSRTAPP